jgi:hypothetical protein
MIAQPAPAHWPLRVPPHYWTADILARHGARHQRDR